MHEMFIPLLKADANQRLVWGRIDETPDRSAEIFDYASSKPHFAAWSNEMQKNSGGKSLGNLRAMHGPTAAGRIEEMSFDDPGRAIQLVARIVDDDAWRKVEEGVYTGFSPGGRYLKRWKEGAYTRYTAQPAEISLVDLPCIPSASFTMVKVDGISEQRPFRALAKEGRRHSATDLSRVQLLHDTSVALGAACPGEAAMTDMDAGGGKMAPSGALAKLAGEIERLQDGLAKLAGERDSLARRIAELEAQPRPGGPALRAIAKGEDVRAGSGDGDGDALEKIRAMPDGLEKSLALIKLAHRKPMVVRY